MRRDRHHGEARPSKGAQTFRRKRALEFLATLEAKEAFLKKQLQTPELHAENTVIAGELKATQSLMEDFVKLFRLHEIEDITLTQEEQA